MSDGFIRPLISFFGRTLTLLHDTSDFSIHDGTCCDIYVVPAMEYRETVKTCQTRVADTREMNLSCSVSPIETLSTQASIQIQTLDSTHQHRLHPRNRLISSLLLILSAIHSIVPTKLSPLPFPPVETCPTASYPPKSFDIYGSIRLHLRWNLTLPPETPSSP